MRSKAEREVIALSENLPPMTLAVRVEAMQSVATVYAGKRFAWCSCCGKEWSSDLWDSRKRTAECPYCGAKGKVKKSAQKKRSDEKFYFTLVQVAGEWQVVRNFFCQSFVRKGEPVFYESCNEVSQCWIKPEHEPIFMGRQVWGGMSACDVWRMNTPIKIKYDHYRYRLCGETGKNEQLLPIIKRNGLRKLRNDANAIYQIEAILKEPRAEILAKGKQWKMFSMYVRSPYAIIDDWASVRVAMRHKYRISDAGMWLDYIAELKKQGKDILNPHYICPDNLRKAHDEAMRLKRRRAAKYEAERKRKEAENAAKRADTLNAKYRERLGAVLDLKIKSGDVVLRPLQDIMDFFKEGEALSHCVYKNEYYKKVGVLVIGARVKNKRMETIELDIKSGTILQCRGKCNKNSPYHQEIYNLMQNNIQKFTRVLQA